MIYFEYKLETAGFNKEDFHKIHILEATDEPWLLPTVMDELSDVFVDSEITNDKDVEKDKDLLFIAGSNIKYFEKILFVFMAYRKKIKHIAFFEAEQRILNFYKLSSAFKMVIREALIIPIVKISKIFRYFFVYSRKKK